MSSSSSSSSKQDLKVENTSVINKEEEKETVTTPKQESLPQEILSANTSEINKEEEQETVTTPTQESLPQEILSENISEINKEEDKETETVPTTEPESPPQEILSENTSETNKEPAPTPKPESPPQEILSENTSEINKETVPTPEPESPPHEILSETNSEINKETVPTPEPESPPHEILSENISEINKEEDKEKEPVPTLEPESPPQEILSENTTPASSNLEIRTANTEKDTIQKADPPKDDDKLFICMKCKKEFPTSDIPNKDDPEEVLEQKLLKSLMLLNSLEAGASSSRNSPFLSFDGASSSRNSPFPSFNGASSSSNNTDFPTLFNRRVIAEMKTTIYRGQYLSCPNYGGAGSSSTNSEPLFGSGVTRGVSSMFSSPTPNRFFTGSRSYRTYRPTPMDYGISGGSKKNKKRVGSWASGEVPREMIDLNKPPCDFVDLASDDEDDKGKGKRVLEGGVKGLGSMTWGIKKRRTR